MFREINSSLQHISNSINQIAKRVNSTDNIYGEDIELLKEKQEEVWRLQKSILSRLP
ncbi:MAG: plasmid mobilization relaxosome protein MobC [Oscillospiraceae bacterium]|nr:plasmid mobilization relaxosome protein MobC [Oscillospiraceae bacterium]